MESFCHMVDLFSKLQEWTNLTCFYVLILMVSLFWIFVYIFYFLCVFYVAQKLANLFIVINCKNLSNFNQQSKRYYHVIAQALFEAQRRIVIFSWMLVFRQWITHIQWFILKHHNQIQTIRMAHTIYLQEKVTVVSVMRSLMIWW